MDNRQPYLVDETDHLSRLLCTLCPFAGLPTTCATENKSLPNMPCSHRVLTASAINTVELIQAHTMYFSCATATKKPIVVQRRGTEFMMKSCALPSEAAAPQSPLAWGTPAPKTHCRGGRQTANYFWMKRTTSLDLALPSLQIYSKVQNAPRPASPINGADHHSQSTP